MRSTPHRRHHHHHHRHRRLLYSFLFKSLPFPSHKLTSAPEPRLVSSRSRPGVIMTRRSWRRWRCWPRSDSGGRSAFRSERQKKRSSSATTRKKKSLRWPGMCGTAAKGKMVGGGEGGEDSPTTSRTSGRTRPFARRGCACPPSGFGARRARRWRGSGCSCCRWISLLVSWRCS